MISIGFHVFFFFISFHNILIGFHMLFKGFYMILIGFCTTSIRFHMVFMRSPPHRIPYDFHWISYDCHRSGHGFPGFHVIRIWFCMICIRLHIVLISFRLSFMHVHLIKNRVSYDSQRTAWGFLFLHNIFMQLVIGFYMIYIVSHAMFILAHPPLTLFQKGMRDLRVAYNPILGAHCFGLPPIYVYTNHTKIM